MLNLYASEQQHKGFHCTATDRPHYHPFPPPPPQLAVRRNVVLAAIALLVMQLQHEAEAAGAATDSTTEHALGWALIAINAIAIMASLSARSMQQRAEAMARSVPKPKCDH